MKNRSSCLLVTLLPLLLLLSGCEEPKPQGFGALLGQDEQGFTKVTANRSIEFPKDHQPHNDFRYEWWYVTANLENSAGETFGVQWTQFRIALAPEEAQNVEQQKANWNSTQIYMAHSAITTPTLHLAQEKWSRAHPEIAGVTERPFRVYLDDWQWNSESQDMFPATLSVAADVFSYELSLSSESAFQLQGDNGYSVKSADGRVASHYYSQPFIDVTGSIQVEGQRHQVTGQAWIDREWSSRFLLGSQQGWDWFALRLDTDTSLVVFQLRDNQTGEANYAYGRLMYRDREGITISADELSLKVKTHSDLNSHPHPTSWQLDIPTHELSLTINAINPNAKMPLTVPYWEGPVQIKGSHEGLGYMELTGY